MDVGISREEHQEFARRQDEENHRQNRRIEELEENARQIGALTTSVEKIYPAWKACSGSLRNRENVWKCSRDATVPCGVR